MMSPAIENILTSSIGLRVAALDNNPDLLHGDAEYNEESYMCLALVGVAKSFLGVVLDQAPKPVAVIFTNQYKGVREDTKFPFHTRTNNAELVGSIVDREHSRSWIRYVFPDIEVVEAPDARKDQVFNCLERETRRRTGAYIHLQGHLWDNRYITAQSPGNETKEGLDAEDMQQILYVTRHLSWCLIVTDFCYSGNRFLLQFVLDIEGNELRWRQVSGWQPCKRARSPKAIIHFAASKSDEPAFEGDQTGGFFTHAIKKTWDNSLTLPEQLRAIQEHVNNSVEDSKTRHGIPPDSRQSPQIFSSVELGLQETHALIKFREGGSA